MSEQSLLHSFIVFNAIPPSEEGADPEVLWYFGNHGEVDKYYHLNQAGLLITFLAFCRRFDTDLPCDYVVTHNHEISLLELSDPIWMGVVLNSSRATNRALLRSLLLYCRSMFSFFFHPLAELTKVPSREREMDPQVLRWIDYAFPLIVNSIDWNHLDFTYIFNTCVMQRLSTRRKSVDRSLASLCRDLISRNPHLIDNVAILYQKRKVVYSTFDHEATRILAFGVRHRFQHLFHHRPAASAPEKLTWLVGRYVNDVGLLSTYQQPIYLDGERHLLLAFKFKRFKIVLTQPPDYVVSEEGFDVIERELGDITAFLDESSPVKITPSVPLSFALAVNDDESRQLTFECVQVDAASRYAIDDNFVWIHSATADYAKKAITAMPAKSRFFLKCDRTDDNRELLLTFSKSNTQGMAQGMTRSLKFCQMIVNNVQRNEKPKSLSCLVQ